MEKKIPESVKNAAQSHGIVSLEYLGAYDGTEVWKEASQKDSDGLHVPTGLPCALLLKDGKTDFIDGLEVLRLPFFKDLQ